MKLSKKSCLAVSCAVLLCDGAVTGCSSTEMVKVIKLNKEINAIENSVRTGSVNVEFSENKIKEYCGYEVNSAIPDKTVRLSADYDVYTKDGNAYIDVDLHYNDVVAKMDLYSDGNNIYIPPESLLNLNDLMYKAEIEVNKYEVLKEELEECEQSGVDYISFDLDNYSNGGMIGIVSETDNESIRNFGEKLYKAYSGMSINGVVSLSDFGNQGVTISADGEQLLNLGLQVLQYTSENIDSIFDETKDLYNYYGIKASEEDKESVRYMCSSLINEIGNIKKAETDEYKEMFENIKYSNVSYSVDKDDVTNAYNQKVSLSIAPKNEEVLKAEINVDTGEYDGDIWTLPDNAKVVSSDEINISNIKPYTCEIVWDATTLQDNYGSTEIHSIFDDKYTSNISSTVKIIDDRAYLPLREVCENLGYSVDWDGSRAWVSDGFNMYDMTGTIINDRTYIKVRDFEKLGVVVEYVEDDTSRIVKLTYDN